MVHIKDLVHPDYNPRLMTEAEAGRLDEELDEFGMVENVVVNRRNMHIVGGNQRVGALRRKGEKKAPVVFVDLDDDAEIRLNLALNKIGGSWDNEKLRTLVFPKLGPDPRNTGFERQEIEGILKAVDRPPRESNSTSSSSALPGVSQTVEFRFGDYKANVPREIYENFNCEIIRIKSKCWPKLDPQDISVIQPLEFVIANSANTPVEET